MQAATGCRATNQTEEHWLYLEHCETLTKMLTKSIDAIMRYIFEGRCTNPQDWETMFRAVTHATFIREYLAAYNSNLFQVAESFLLQFEDWNRELSNRLN